MNLYDIAAEYRAAAEHMADLGLPDEVVRDTLEGMAGSLEQKAVAVAQVSRNLESLAHQIRDAEKQMAERRRAIEARAESIRRYLLNGMEMAGVSSIECPYFAIKVRQNPTSVAVLDESAIPQQYWRQPEPPPPSVDKKAIAEALKAGEDVPGARLERGTRIEIK